MSRKSKTDLHCQRSGTLSAYWRWINRPEPSRGRLVLYVYADATPQIAHDMRQYIPLKAIFVQISSNSGLTVVVNVIILQVDSHHAV